MKKRFLSHLFLGLCGVYFLLLTAADAQYLIEFTDGRQMTVPSYKEEGEKVKVYTPSGSFAFRKDDIKRIETLHEPEAKKTGPESLDGPARVERPKPEPAPVVAPAEPLKTEKPAPKGFEGDLTPTDQLWDALSHVPMENFFDFVTSSLYQLRYLIGLLALGKILKIFLIGSMR